MMVVYGDHVSQFLNGLAVLKDGQSRCARPITATNNETVQDVESLIVEITIQRIAYVLSVSTYIIDSDQLHMTRVSLR